MKFINHDLNNNQSFLINEIKVKLYKANQNPNQLQRQIMITQSSLKCPSCHLFFGFQNTPKILKNCHHIICLNCLQTTKNCPIDGKDINVNKWGLKSFLTDTRILQQIQRQTYLSGPIKEQVRFSFSNQHKSKIEQNKLFEPSFGSKQKLSTWQLCKTHMKKADFVCEDDCRIVCGSCIASQEHKNHRFISYEELLKQLTELTDKTYKIYESLNMKSQPLTKRNIDSFIEEQITKKKERQSYQIRVNFQNLIEAIRKQQKNVLQRLDDIAANTTKTLKSQIDVNGFRKSKQQWGSEVHKLISVMESVYDYAGFDKAFQYFRNQSQKAFLIDQGLNLMHQLRSISQNVNEKIGQQIKKIQCQFDHQFIQRISNLCKFSLNETDNCVDDAKIYQHSKWTRIRPNLKMCHSFSQKISLANLSIKHSVQSQLVQQISQLKLENEDQPDEPSQNSQNYLSEQNSQYQDFLLDTQKSQYRHNQTLTKNQITFEQNFSLLDNNPMPTREEFTPILRKEQDSMSVLQDQSTIINMNNIKKHQQNSPLLYTKSNDITIEIKPIKAHKNMCSSYQKVSSSSYQKIPNQSEQLSKTFVSLSTSKKERSPLKSLNSNTISQSYKNKLGLPQKYIPAWQCAKHDSTQTIDFTGAQLGDSITLQLASHLLQSQHIKSVKLIRNKLTDSIIPDIIQRIAKSNITSLNLSQNMLTDKTLSVLENMDLGNLKSITLSLNRIVLRKVRDRIQKFKQRGITLTV